MKNLATTFLQLIKNRWKIIGSIFFILIVLFWCSLPNPLFDQPTSFVIEAADGQLLGARIAEDGQWRFPSNGVIADKFETAILTFEDNRFYSHWGVDFLAMGRAIFQNIKNKRVVSGGSTLSMQVIRLSRKGKPRTLLQKLIEIILAFRLELGYSKKEILSSYASNAPFGGNVVGLEAASWRYFWKKSTMLSWAEATTLAVLPNAPSFIHPGKNRNALIEKRNRLLQKIYEKGLIDSITLDLAIAEPLPSKPLPLPQDAPHLLNYVASVSKDKKVYKTTIDYGLQKTINEIANRYHPTLSNNEIHNLAILVLDVATKKVLAYVGNAKNAGFEHGQSVDIIQAPRSTGSILKPILYALALQDGQILPKSLLQDIPTFLKDYRPENFLNTYDGVIPADLALSRSLNIPFVRLLQSYGVEKFHFNLKKLGISTLSNGPNHYGLSLILGGSEATLWDLTNLYSGMACRLKYFYKNQGWYNESDFDKSNLSWFNKKSEPRLQKETAYLTADAIWLTFEAMKKLERPNAQGEWERFDLKNEIAWKTGTSFGFRDAWAIGVNPNFAIGVWTGNADGEGRPGLTGISAAAPILFDVFDQLPFTPWFDQPFDEMNFIEVCAESGYLPNKNCPIDSIWVQKNTLNIQQCPYHQLVHLDATNRKQVNISCYPHELIINQPWFVLPPTEEHYYVAKHPNYRPLPVFSDSCELEGKQNENIIQLIYPNFKARIFMPIDINGEKSKTVFKAIHRSRSALLHWNIDKEFIGTTKEIHEMEINTVVGKHVLTLVDEQGNRLEQTFEIIEKAN
ncbi:MAG: penicillin-binding protein 1C [Saprospiraceae bacterium]